MPAKLSYRIFLSESLKEKIISLLEQHPPEIKNFRRDKLFYILSLIHEIPARNKRNGLSDHGYTNLHTPLLKKFIYNYREHLDYLMLHIIIECDYHYIPGQKSKGYRIARDYIAPVKPAVIQNPELIRKLRRYKWEIIGRTKKYKYLQKWMDGLEIDFNSAMDYINAQYFYRINNPDAREWDFKRKRYKDPLEQYNSAKVNIYYLKDKRFYFFVDPNVGRLHTNLTNIQSDLRNFITYKGQQLVSIDISNSQPYLSAKLFSLSFYEQPVKGSNKLTIFSFSNLFLPPSLLSPSFSTSPSLPSSNPLPPLMFPKPLQKYEQQDVKLFRDLVQKGQLYEHLAEVFKAELGLAFSNRKNTKAAIFQLLYTDNRFIGQPEAAPKRIFKELFPNVYGILSDFKKEDPTILPRLLQQMEAKLILDIIAKRISKEMPNIPIFTIHDSITTTLDNLVYVQRIMTEELTNHIGITPNLKTEYWEQGHLRTDFWAYPDLGQRRQA